jgi:ankyrin repeat protein
MLLSAEPFFLFEVHALSLSHVCCLRFPFFLQNGATALMWAARNGRADVAEALVAAGADKNATDKVS